jgi:hypothetical protein
MGQPATSNQNRKIIWRMRIRVAEVAPKQHRGLIKKRPASVRPLRGALLRRSGHFHEAGRFGNARNHVVHR